MIPIPSASQQNIIPHHLTFSAENPHFLVNFQTLSHIIKHLNAFNIGVYSGVYDFSSWGISMLTDKA